MYKFGIQYIVIPSKEGKSTVELERNRKASKKYQEVEAHLLKGEAEKVGASVNESLWNCMMKITHIDNFTQPSSTLRGSWVTGRLPLLSGSGWIQATGPGQKMSAVSPNTRTWETQMVGNEFWPGNVQITEIMLNYMALVIWFHRVFVMLPYISYYNCNYSAWCARLQLQGGGGQDAFVTQPEWGKLLLTVPAQMNFLSLAYIWLNLFPKTKTFVSHQSPLNTEAGLFICKIYILPFCPTGPTVSKAEFLDPLL